MIFQMSWRLTGLQIEAQLLKCPQILTQTLTVLWPPLTVSRDSVMWSLSSMRDGCLSERASDMTPQCVMLRVLLRKATMLMTLNITAICLGVLHFLERPQRRVTRRFLLSKQQSV